MGGLWDEASAVGQEEGDIVFSYQAVDEAVGEEAGPFGAAEGAGYEPGVGHHADPGVVELVGGHPEAEHPEIAEVDVPQFADEVVVGDGAFSFFVHKHHGGGDIVEFGEELGELELEVVA